MNILKIFPFIKLEIFNKEPCFIVKTNLLDKALFLMKNQYQFKMLTCISGVDYPNNTYRFQVVYELLSLRFNLETHIKCFVNITFGNWIFVQNIIRLIFFLEKTLLK